MSGGVVYLGPGAGLDDLAQVHDRHPVADMPHDGQVVGDEQVGEAKPVLQFLQQVHDPGLDGDVECRHGFVEHQHLGVEGEGPRDADTLPLATGELVREAVAVLGVEAHQLEEPVDALRALLAVPAPVHPQRLRHDLADRHPRVEGGVRILEHDLHVLPHRPELLPALAGELVAPIANRPRGRGEQLKDGARRGRLAAA